MVTVATTTEEMPLANPQGKTVEELKEVAVTLQTQAQEHQKQDHRVAAARRRSQAAFISAKEGPAACTSAKE